jgi:hypothetical protein
MSVFDRNLSAINEREVDTPRNKGNIESLKKLKTPNNLVIICLFKQLGQIDEKECLDKFKKPNLKIGDDIYSYAFADLVDRRTQPNDKSYSSDLLNERQGSLRHIPG